MIKLIIIVSVVVFASSCHEDPPSSIDNNPKSIHPEFQWTIDTLFYVEGGQVLLQSIWGTSAKNVYAVGHDAHTGIATMWHFNGVKWSRVILLSPLGGAITVPIVMYSVSGVDSSNIFAVGERVYQTFFENPPYFLDSSMIIHFDGSIWRETKIQRARGKLTSISVGSASNIWAVGTGKSVYHFDGLSWERDTLPINLADSVNESCNSRITVLNDGKVCITMRIDNPVGGNSRRALLIRSSNQWTLVDSFSISNLKWDIGNHWKTIDGELYASGKAIYKLESDTWKIIYSSTQISFPTIWGSSKTDIFAAGSSNKLIHYNGVDWKYIAFPSLEGIALISIWGSNGEIYITGNDGNKSYLFHGKQGGKTQ